jgi:hypothetical protein
VIQSQNGNALRLNTFDHFVHDLRSRIVRDSEINFKSVDQVEDRFATTVEPLAFTPVRAGGAANFGHVEFGQFQGLSGFGKAVESRWFYD